MLKWISGILLLVLIVMMAIVMSRNVTGERLFGKIDALNKQIASLESERSWIDGGAPSRKIIAEV